MLLGDDAVCDFYVISRNFSSSRRYYKMCQSKSMAFLFLAFAEPHREPIINGSAHTQSAAFPNVYTWPYTDYHTSVPIRLARGLSWEKRGVGGGFSAVERGFRCDEQQTALLPRPAYENRAFRHYCDARRERGDFFEEEMCFFAEFCGEVALSERIFSITG